MDAWEERSPALLRMPRLVPAKALGDEDAEDVQ